jgi:cell division topological specificity factor
MSFLDYLLGTRKKTATVAKDRLQIILARERVDRKGPDFLPELRQELLQVISKYVKIDLDQVKVNLEHDGNFEVLELNIVLPESINTVKKTAS